MKRVALAFVLGIAAVLLMLPPTASAWTRGGHGVVVAGPGFVVAGPRIPVPVPVPVVRPFPHRVFVAPRPVFVGPRAFVAPPVPFFAPPPLPGCAHWWWNGWRWVWVRGC